MRRAPTHANLRSAFQLRDEWRGDGVAYEDLLRFANEFNLTGDTMTTHDLEKAVCRRRYQCKRLTKLLTDAGLFDDDGELNDAVRNIDRAITQELHGDPQ